LGNVLYAQGNYDEARPLYERALAIYENVSEAVLSSPIVVSARALS
jgi:tetratricopeptide (TPR) repeat protein